MNFLIACDITAGSRIPARMYGRILRQAPRKRYLAFLLKQNITLKNITKSRTPDLPPEL